jgi:hypothetical protein
MGFGVRLRGYMTNTNSFDGLYADLGNDEMRSTRPGKVQERLCVCSVCAAMTIRRQFWRFIFVFFGVVVCLVFTPAVQSGPHKLISYLSEVHYACAYAVMMFAALWIFDFLRWISARQK